MTTLTERQTPRSKRDNKDYSSTGEIAVSVIWLAFYLAILVFAITSPILSNAIEIAARY